MRKHIYLIIIMNTEKIFYRIFPYTCTFFPKCLYFFINHDTYGEKINEFNHLYLPLLWACSSFLFFQFISKTQKIHFPKEFFHMHIQSLFAFLTEQKFTILYTMISGMQRLTWNSSEFDKFYTDFFCIQWIWIF